MTRQQKSLKILFVTDPLESFNVIAETTLYLMCEAERRGHKIYATRPWELSYEGDQVFGQIAEIKIVSKNSPLWFKVIKKSRLSLEIFDAILPRKDPPFDMEFVNHLYLLELLAEKVYLMNSPQGILLASEKLFPLPFKNLIPKTLISASEEELRAFVQKNKVGTIIKPLGGSGGKGVFYIKSPEAENVSVILETATSGYAKHVVAQSYLPEAKKGDKRILLLGAEILGAFHRKPAKGEHRANLHMGGQALKTKITGRDREIVAQLRPSLARLKLDFVGLDVIGDYLIEVNVTSPMGIHELNLTQDRRSEVDVLDFMEKQIFLLKNN